MKMAPISSFATESGRKAGVESAPVYSVTKHQGFVRSDEYFQKQVFSRDLSGYKLVEADTFAYATIHLDEGSIGISPERALISPMYTAFSVDLDRVMPRYLIRVLKSPRALQAYSYLGNGSAHRRRSIPFSRLKTLQIPLPSLDEQQRIADILDKADALRAKRREAMAHLDSLGQSIFHEMFQGSPNALLGDLGVVQGGLQVTKKRDGYSLRRPYLRVANVFKGWIDTTLVKEMGVTPAEADRVSLQSGDLLFVEGHGNQEEVGRCAVWSDSSPGMVHQNHLIRYRPNKMQLLPEYAAMAVNTLPRGRSLQRRAKTTSGLNTITASDVRELSIPLAPLEEQTAYCTRLEVLKRVKGVALDELAELDNLFLSLQDRAFKGEL